MRRLLFLVNHDVVIYNFRLEILEEFLKEGEEVYVSSPYGERIDELVRIGCRYIRTEMSRHGTNPAEELRLLHRYRTMMREIRPDLVFTFTVKPNIYGGLAAQSLWIPYVTNITGLGTAVERGGMLQIITVELYRLALRRVQTVFFQNTENRAFFEERGIGEGRRKLLPGSGVNIERYRPLPYPGEETVEFVFISRIMKEKGIERYLEAAEKIGERYPNTRFHICGFCEEAYEERLRELSERGVIRYHGMIRDIREILEATHCTVHPTRYAEGMSNVLLESAACGRPVIATDRSGCREIVEDGETGYLMRKDAGDLIEKIEKFLRLSNEERRRMGLAGRRKVEREFDRRIVVDAYKREVIRMEQTEK